MGLRPARCRSTSQRNVVARKMFTAKCTPSESPLNGFFIAIGRIRFAAEPLRFAVASCPRRLREGLRRRRLEFPARRSRPATLPLLLAPLSLAALTEERK